MGGLVDELEQVFGTVPRNGCPGAVELLGLDVALGAQGDAVAEEVPAPGHG
jgi:hypothetical protein